MSIEVYNRQRAVRVGLPWLRGFARLALENCREHSADGRHALRGIGHVEVTIVSDRVIASVHERFMNIAGATDVITFEHGEIVASAQAAAAHARRYGHSLEQELGLYIIHGLLHLNGYDDAKRSDAARMRRTQQRILRACLARLPNV